MQTKRHHFTVETASGKLDALVPDERGELHALERLKEDDPAWRQPSVRYHGLVDYYDRIDFTFAPNRAVA